MCTYGKGRENPTLRKRAWGARKFKSALARQRGLPLHRREVLRLRFTRPQKPRENQRRANSAPFLRQGRQNDDANAGRKASGLPGRRRRERLSYIFVSDGRWMARSRVRQAGA